MRDQPAMLRSTTGETMTLEGVEAKGRVRGLLFELDVEQRYRNARDANVEAIYTFPVPGDAVLLDLDVTLNGKKLVAAVVEKRAAERDYEKAIDGGDTAIMLERAGDGLCTLNLGNLMAGETATIRYRYAQLLRFEHGSVRLTVPTVIAPRYGDPKAAGLRPHQVPKNDLAVAYPFALSVDLEGEIAGGTLASPSHAFAITATASGMHVVLARGAYLDRDFVLTVSGLEGRSLAVVARDDERFVALASFCADVPREASEHALTLKLLVDCSGSMTGDSIAAAKRALHRILASLDPVDRLSYSRFGSRVVHETKGLVPANDANIHETAKRVGRTYADLGGTEMAAALRQVFAIGDDDHRGGARSTQANPPLPASGERVELRGDIAVAADVLLLTDGEVWDADHLIAEARGARQRVFVVGIGSAPAEGVLRRLAEATGGACEFVAPNEDAEAAILRMFARMRAPRVDRAEARWPAPLAWVTPLPAGLFGGETIHAFAGFDAAPTGAITLTLHSKAESRPLTAAAQLGATIVEDRTLARIAAARRIESASEVDKVRLALDYGLLTGKTNLLVVHARAEGDKATDLPRLAHVAQMHAAGWHGVGSVVARCVDSVSFDKLDAPYLDRQTVRFCQATEESREPNASLPPETYDYEGIPTFPRAKADYSASSGRAADTGQGSHVPRDTDTAPSPASIDSIDSVLAKLESAGAGGLPRTFADLECLGVPPGVLSMLRMSLVLPAGEDEIVKAFLEALATWDAEASRPPILARHTSRAMRIVFAFPWSWHALRVEARRAVEHWHRLATIAEIGAASSRAPGEAAVAR